VPRCRRCDGEFDAEELVRHDQRRVVFVHCPECGFRLGEYREPGRE
jgi:DNA-directed RNA polymerase subunit RPC12/RpoP